MLSYVMLCYVMLCYACMYLYICTYSYTYTCVDIRDMLLLQESTAETYLRWKISGRSWNTLPGRWSVAWWRPKSFSLAPQTAQLEEQQLIRVHTYIYIYIIYILYIYTYNTCRHVHVCQCRVHKLKLLLCAAIRFRCCPVPNCFEAAKDSATRRKKFGMEWKNASPRTSRWRKRQKIMAPACWKPSLDSR